MAHHPHREGKGNHEPYVDSGDVNDYLREISGADFTAKDFRTWAGTVLACAALRRLATARTKNEARKNVVRAIAEVAERLGNTPAVCRKAYIHPRVFDRYLEAHAAGLTVRSAVFPAAGKTSSRRAATRLDIDEAADRVSNFINSMTMEIQMLARACGKSNVHDLEPEDLRALTLEASFVTGIPVVGTNIIFGRPDLQPQYYGLSAANGHRHEASLDHANGKHEKKKGRKRLDVK